MVETSKFNRFGKKWLLPAIIISIIYWLWYGLVVGVDFPSVLLFVLFAFLFFYNSKSRILGICFSPLFIYLFFFNSLKVLHQFNGFPIHLEDLYQLEVQLLGVNYEGIKISLCEYFNYHQSTLFDVISGLFYVTWAPFPILFGLILFYKRKQKLLFDFWMCFLIANLFGFTGYVLYPAAPPWYFFEYGNQILVDTPNSGAGLLRFDALIGFPLYKGLYTSGTNTFGAMPSMHAAFPIILVYYARKHGNRTLLLLFIVSMICIWFGAVYSNHHYVLDLFGGFFCAIMAIIITESIVNRKFALLWYQKVVDYIS